MRRLGLKLYSINSNYVSLCEELYKNKLYDFIELYIVPGSYEEYINLWKRIKIPFVIHAPHYMHGMNLALKDKEKCNISLFKEAFQFADVLGTDTIICHPGVGGEIKETIRQINIIDDARIAIENKPYHAIFDPNLLCNGSTLEDISLVLSETNVKFCLDVGHCFCAANSLAFDRFNYLNRFLELDPTIVHLSDNDQVSTIDKHMHFGHGSYELNKICKCLPEDILITIETQKDSDESLDDFAQDVKCLKNIWE